MKPLDLRLLRYAGAARGFLLLAVALGLAQVLLVLAFAWLLAALLTTAIGDVFGAPITDFPVPGGLSTAGMLGGLGVVVALRAALSWAVEVCAARAAVKVKSQLRGRTAQALTSAVAGGRAEAASHQLNQAQAVNVLGSGLDALDNYFSRYLPQLVLTALAVPVHLAVLAVYDMTTAVIVALTMPLIPVFMVLIGWSTQAAQQRQRERLSHLARAYLDLVEGLSTLKVFNRQHHQRQNLVRISEAHRRSTMKVLRISFLSGFVLELAASLSVALVAVSIGVRLIDGSLGLFVGLFALLIVPEAYAPLRQVGVNYHAAADGVAAAEDIFEILDVADQDPGAHDDVSPRPEIVSPPPRGGAAREVQALSLQDLGARRGGTPVLSALTCRLPAGALTAITGPSGGGKSTFFATLLGLLPCTGSVELELADGRSRPLLREDIAWSGQRSGLRSGTVLENIALGDPAADPQTAQQVLQDLGLQELELDRELGVRGEGLSGGQAHRVAVARALYRARRRGCPVLLLDEPSAALDPEAEDRLLQVLQEEAQSGRVVVVITHRRRLAEAAAHRFELKESNDHAAL